MRGMHQVVSIFATSDPPCRWVGWVGEAAQGNIPLVSTGRCCRTALDLSEGLGFEGGSIDNAHEEYQVLRKCCSAA